MKNHRLCRALLGAALAFAAMVPAQAAVSADLASAIAQGTENHTAVIAVLVTLTAATAVWRFIKRAARGITKA